MGIDSIVDSLLSLVILILKYLWEALLMTGLQIFILIGPGIILAFIMNFIASLTEKGAYRIMGSKLYLYTFGWLGTAIHEIGHAIFCIIFGHKITEMKLFSIDTYSGTLGHVNHSYNPDSFYQQIGNFFIGIGPILFGSFVIYYLSRYLLGADIFISSKINSIDYTSFSSFESIFVFLKNVFNNTISLLGIIFSLDNFSNWKFYLFLYLAFSIGSSITLSKADIEGASGGFGVLVASLFLLNIATLWATNFFTELFISVSQSYSSFYSVMLFVIILNIIISTLFLILPQSASKTKNTVQAVMNRRKYKKYK
ncbi:MAG: hypothetical protein K9I95_14470 [Flavobacteriaceae bacterium]|nr:hypothetical protein [Flavobacteriaceae bacterium]MCF8428359.1 hypothetical protein [Bacteroidia bacterium]